MTRIQLKQSLFNFRSKYVALAIAALVCVLAIAGIVDISKRDAIHVAIAAPISGERHLAGEEMVNSVRLYFDRVNQQGGVNGRPLKLQVYDDWDNPVVAMQHSARIAASPAVAALGHLTSSTSLGAASLYSDAQIPVITGTASLEALTQDNSFYFRTTFTNLKQGQLTALYARDILNFETASVIYADDAFGESLYRSFQSVFGEGDRQVNAWYFSPEGEDDLVATAARIVDDLTATPNPGVLYLAMDSIWAKYFIVALHQRGTQMPIIGNDTFAREVFPSLFAEERDPVSVDGIKVPVPIILDSSGAEAQAFAKEYQNLYGKVPTYVGTGFYNAAKILVQAIEQAEIANTPSQRQLDRHHVRDALEAIDEPQKAVSGLNGLLYFDENHNITPPIRFGQYVGTQLISAPLQLNPVGDLRLVDLNRELASGSIVSLNAAGQTDYYWKQDVVYTGIDINKLSSINPTNSSYSVDFYLWMRYLGDSDVVTAIEFPEAIANSSDPNLPPFDPAAPARTSVIDGINYRLYRINAEFKENYDFRDYPFDRQQLKIKLQNIQTPSDRLIYVVDTFGLEADLNRDRTKPYQSLELWQFKELQYAQEIFELNSTRGNPLLFESNLKVDYPGVSATVTLQRRFNVFLVKTLLPLGLLVLVLYSTLYFSENLAKERLTVAISALLSSAVLLTSINAQLADAGYTVAIEYGFYIFFGLCLFGILVGLGVEKLRELEKPKRQVKYLNIFARVFYVVVVLGTVTTYTMLYGDRL